jgi:hypothetical protein
VPVVDYAGFEAGDDTVIWRYMPRSRFRDVAAGRLYFAAAHQFDDQFEGAITQAENARREYMTAQVFKTRADREDRLKTMADAFAELREMTKISCWHAREHENAAMWERYRSRAEPAVAIVSNVGSLKRALHEYRLQPNYGAEEIRVGAVRYIDYERDEMGDTSMLGIFLHKRREYGDEREVRALLSLRMASEFGVTIPKDGVEVCVDSAKLIHEVRAAPTASDTDIGGLAAIAHGAGVSCPVSRSTLAVSPRY